MANFLELQKIKVAEYKASAEKTQQEMKALEEKFNEHTNAQKDLQKAHTEATDRLKAFNQSIFVLEGVIKDIEAPAEAPAEDSGLQPDPGAEPMVDSVEEVFAEEAGQVDVGTLFEKGGKEDKSKK